MVLVELWELDVRVAAEHALEQVACLAAMIVWVGDVAVFEP